MKLAVWTVNLKQTFNEQHISSQTHVWERAGMKGLEFATCELRNERLEKTGNILKP